MITSFNPSSLPSWRFSLARQVLGAGGVVAYPTEGVWGLGCDPDNAEAVARILEMKQRSWTQGLILIADSICRFAPWLAGLTDEQRQKLDNWPVGVTCLIPHNGRASALVAGQHSRLAIRVTDHPIAAGLARAQGGPIVSTSANPHGRPAARNATQVRGYFGSGAGAAIDLLVPGELGQAGGASEIRDLQTGKITRSGASR